MTTRLVSDDELVGEAAAEAAFRSVCSMIASHATARPDHPAVVDGAGRATYGELLERSGVLAARLAERGVGPGSCVGILLERSVEFVVAAYAVLRTGAAYLPLDVATPAERLAFVLEDSGAAVVVAREGAAQPPAGPWTTVEVGERGVALFSGGASGPDDLAYVIYTSGSTGRPKGVELTHANLANLVGWHVEAFAVTAADRAAQVASVGFDAAVWEIWPALAAGATLLVPDEGVRRSAPVLRDWLVAEQVGVAFAPTVLAEQLLDLDWPVSTRLRTLLTGADVLHRRPPAGLPFVLVNNYGPTECTVVATSGRVDPGSGVPSIGRPIGDTVALVLDDALQPVAVGEAGELCLGGALVGRGYRGDPELTGQKFVTVHRDDGPPLRVYRTGDRVRALVDGSLAFLGRSDRQVKLRGYRIEPAEIVAALNGASGVAAAAVVARAGEHDAEPALVAYVVPAEGVTLTAGELRERLAASLPEYMVPGVFVGVATLPVTLHGKLDEGSLPAPSPENLLAGRGLAGRGLAGRGDPVSFPAPRTSPDDAPPADAGSDGAGSDGAGSVGARVAEMVCQLLAVPSVDPDDNIFLVGGHSMLAMQLVARIKQTFGVKLTLRQVFEAPTVTGLTATVTERTGAQTATPSPTAGATR